MQRNESIDFLPTRIIMMWGTTFWYIKTYYTDRVENVVVQIQL